MRQKNKRQKLYGNDVEAMCKICAFGRVASDEKAVLCTKKGIVPLYYKCRKFEYDPLKRIPTRMPKTRGFSAEDFSID